MSEQHPGGFPDAGGTEAGRAAEPEFLRSARGELARLGGVDLPGRIAGYDEVHRLLREALAELDARPAAPPRPGPS